MEIFCKHQEKDFSELEGNELICMKSFDKKICPYRKASKAKKKCSEYKKLLSSTVEDKK